MTSNLPSRRRGNKPRKPHPEFSLTAHPNGQWSKKIRGKVYYFGSRADPAAALERYLDAGGSLSACNSAESVGIPISRPGVKASGR